MQTQNESVWKNSAVRDQVRQAAFSPLIAAALMLFFGFFWYRGLEGSLDSWIYNLSVKLFVGTLQIGGILMLLSAAICWTGRPQALLIDTVLTAIIGGLILVEGLTWLVHGDGEGILLLIVGIFFAYSAKGTWTAYSGILAVGTKTVWAKQPDERQAPSSSAPQDPQAKEQALKRLLAKKQKEAVVESKTDFKEKTDAEESTGDSAPEGYLSELGRDNEQTKI
ncbi:MAG: hypothetical protein JSV03_07965 [Planctomycetota bacterium]|nr:MAG: hypothetical protein JSV03_07965 [Planctomycetota bacterium]